MRKKLPPEVPYSMARDMAMVTGIFLSCLIILSAIAAAIGLYKRHLKTSKKIEYHKNIESKGFLP
ncbi:hypothetical protein [Paraflavitalea pollutisoli]|uniref:hypothetical protein n=1 Tax=Paraflavitalea pollutisoli TaxID=3034143 RepID=UPI0023EAD68B|nr:hypothetical protein [Paraflavitalea sp. H1-2-19X]